MSLKLIEMTIGKDAEPFAYEKIKDEGVLGIWSQKLENNQSIIRMLVIGRQVESIMDLLTEKYGDLEEFRTVVVPVEASLPRFRINERVISDSQGHVYVPADVDRPERMSREELYVTVGDATNPTTSFLVLVILSSVVAAVGVLRDNVAIAIGAMVIAPLLGPSIALALGTTLGDINLIRTAVKANVLGIGLSYLVAVAIGFLVQAVDFTWVSNARTTLNFADVVLALASGAAGVLGFTGRLLSALVGVMVAVALLPPLVTAGLIVGMGNYSNALPPALLFLTNLICVNLSAVVTLIAQGVRPGLWDETQRASIGVVAAIIIWFVFLAAAVALIIYLQRAGFFTI